MRSKKKYLPVESAACYNFSVLVRKVKEELKKRFPKTSHEEFLGLMYKNLSKFSINNQEFEYSHQNNYLGGARWFVKCPKCGKNCFRLYLPKEESGRERLYLCKVCHDLKNASSLMGASKKYKHVVKPLKQLEKIKIALLKKGMTAEKAAPLLDAYEKIENQLASNSEYRLWKFQQKHKQQA